MTFPIRFALNGDLYYIMSRIITYILIVLFNETSYFQLVDWTYVDAWIALTERHLPDSVSYYIEN